MDTILQELLDLAGVGAAMVFDGTGHLAGHRGRAVYDRPLGPYQTVAELADKGVLVRNFDRPGPLAGCRRATGNHTVLDLPASLFRIGRRQRRMSIRQFVSAYSAIRSRIRSRRKCKMRR